MGKLKWHIILVLALWLMFCGMASATQLYVNESGWWRDGCAFNPSSSPIGSAVDAADNGDSIFVYNGSYTEYVAVYKRLTLIGEGADVVTVTRYSWKSSVFFVMTDWVTIAGFTVTGATKDGESGIHIRYADHCNISGNYASNNYYGIRLYYSSNNTLSNNTANSNNCDGIVLHSSNGNTLMNNTANSNCDDGIALHSSSDCTLTSNVANSNNGDGIYLDSSSDNIITCNRVQDNIERGFYLYESSTSNNVSYNNIIENGALQGDGSYHWQFYNYQSNPVEAKHNYWGAGMNSSTIDASIYDDGEGGGRVDFYPFETEPVPCTPTPDTDISWNATNFAGFWYDLDHNVATETLTIDAGTLAGPDIDRTIDEGDLVYNTTATYSSFELSKWGQYKVIGFMTESYFAGYEKGVTDKDITNENINLLSKDMLSKVLIDVEDDRMISTGASLQLEEGYELKVIQLDVDGGQAQLELMKNGKSVDTEIVHSPDTYVYTKDLGKLDDVPIITVHISSILSDAETDMVVIDGIFQISENYTSVKIGDVYGEMEVKSVIESGIIMKNNRSIDLDAGTRQHVMGDMYFRIADDATAIRFYPFVERIIGNGADEIAPADAVIALQIAVGSRPPDSRYDVSGDGSVTSLDALMILQAVAGSIEIS